MSRLRLSGEGHVCSCEQAGAAQGLCSYTGGCSWRTPVVDGLCVMARMRHMAGDACLLAAAQQLNVLCVAEQVVQVKCLW